MDKQILVHPYNGIILSNTEEQITDTHKSLDGYQGYYAEWNMPDKKKMLILLI